jgi:hypothetical protein
MRRKPSWPAPLAVVYLPKSCGPPIRTQGKTATDTPQPVDPIDDLLSRLRSSFPGAQIIRG